MKRNCALLLPRPLHGCQHLAADALHPARAQTNLAARVGVGGGRVLLRNLTAQPMGTDIQVTVTDPAGKSSVHPQRVTRAPNSPEQTISIQPPVPVYGLDTVQTPVTDLALELDDLTVEYARPEDMTDAPVKVQMAATDVLLQGELAQLPNPHVVLQEKGVGPAPVMAKLSPTDETQYEGNRLHIDITPVEGVKNYKGYVAVYPDGRGARCRWALTSKPNTGGLR